MSRDAEVHSITSAQPGPSEDLRHRERQYLFLMGMRMVAIVVAVVVSVIIMLILMLPDIFNIAQEATTN